MPADTHRSILYEIKPAVVRLSKSEYHLWWVNRPSSGSRERRGVREANKPDGTFMKEQFDVAFAEIKAPKNDGSIRLYIQHKWALISLAKDTIDLHLRERRTITSIYCLQVFVTIVGTVHLAT
ncbi:hypothetical protein BGZ47_002557 [Haplosporangium gracile]|nr:hypothetical protein BGZ47_002557 [Haplosporangium gracile]